MARPVQILTDSCSDMPKEIREKYDIDYVRMNTVYEGKETPASLDFEYYSSKELYDTMRNGGRVTTTQVPVSEFERAFGQYLSEGKDVVYIGCALKQSSSVNTGAVVAKRLLEKEPEAKIFCIDALNACFGEALLAMRAAEYRDQGLNAEEIHEKILGDRNFVNEYCTVHTLDYMKRAGRVTASTAFFGNLFGVKPIIIADSTGAQAAYKKVKGRQTSMQEIVNLLKETIVDSENQTVYVLHGDCLDEAEELAKMVKEAIPCKDVYTTVIGPIIGASLGPDALSLFAWGKEVTFVGESK